MIRKWSRLALASAFLGIVVNSAVAADEPAGFRVGAAERDITPPAGLPMWGYGARHDKPSEGTLDPLLAKTIVIEAGKERLAIIGMDLGRGPTSGMMDEIRKEAAAEGVNVRHVLICGSHTHHGPVIELVDEPGRGQGRFHAAVAYCKKLPALLVESIKDAVADLKPARIGVATKNVSLNRNRQSKRQPPATDPMLAAVRFDDEHGQPIAVLVNFAAHPVLTDNKVLKYSADYPGFLRKRIESALGTRCVFMQGASGDMSCNPGPIGRAPQAFGEALADHAIELARNTETEKPAKPSLAGKVDAFHFKSRVNWRNPLVTAAYELSFFPEIVHNYVHDWKDGIDAELSTILLNGDLAIVAGSGEFFCNHAVRLRERSYLKHTLFFGYCNGHQLYFPTIEAVSEGGYGADPPVAPVEVGAGEQMMDRALINIYTMQGKIAPARD
jgi:hypothetical protein